MICNKVLIMSAIVQLWLWKYSLPFLQKERQPSEKSWYLNWYYHHLGKANTHRNLFLTQAKHPYVSTSVPWLTNDIFGNACTHIFNWTLQAQAKKLFWKKSKCEKWTNEKKKYENFCLCLGIRYTFFFSWLTECRHCIERIVCLKGNSGKPILSISSFSNVTIGINFNIVFHLSKLFER